MTLKKTNLMAIIMIFAGFAAAAAQPPKPSLPDQASAVLAAPADEDTYDEPKLGEEVFEQPEPRQPTSHRVTPSGIDSWGTSEDLALGKYPFIPLSELSGVPIPPEEHKLDKSGKVRVGGVLKSRYIDLGLYGPFYPTSPRYRPWNQTADIAFYAKPLEKLEAIAVFRLQNNFGGYWGNGDIFGVRRISFRGDYPIYFEIGDYQKRLTPFTLMTFDDEELFEAKFFLDKKQRNRDELFLLPDQSRPLSGIRLGTYQAWGKTGKLGMGLEGFAARLGQAGQTNDYFTYLHDRYLAAGSFYFHVMENFLLRGNSLYITDLPDSGDPSQPVFINRIYGADGRLQIASQTIQIQGEWDKSQSNTQVGHADYFGDTASRAEVALNLYGFRLAAGAAQVGGDYLAPGSQTRLRDAVFNPPWTTENNTWDASTNWFATTPIFPHYDPNKPLIRYNPQIIPLPRAHYYLFENHTFPYGPATPNRQSYQASLQWEPAEKFIRPIVKYVQARELVDTLGGDGKMNFKLLAAGALFNWWVFTGSGGYQMEDTQNGNHIAVTTSTINAGLETRLVKELSLLLGYKHRDFNGSDLALGGFQAHMDSILDQYGVALKAKPLANVEVVVEYQFSKWMDLAAGDQNADIHEADAMVRLAF